MKAKGILLVCVLLIIGLFVFPGAAWAHETVTVGEYAVEYGWVSEPAVAGQPNAVVINLTGSSSDSEIDVSNLKIEAVYGGERKFLTLQPLGENTPGQFTAPITPTRPGKYTIHLSGTVGTTAFNTDVQPEEVQTADVVQFPALTAGALANSDMSASGMLTWLAVAGILLGVVGIGLAVLALTRRPTKG